MSRVRALEKSLRGVFKGPGGYYSLIGLEGALRAKAQEYNARRYRRHLSQIRREGEKALSEYSKRYKVNPIPSRWTDARVMRTRRGQVKVMLLVKRKRKTALHRRPLSKHGRKHRRR